MAESPKIAFTDLKPADGGVLVVLTDEELGLGPVTKRALAPAGDLVARAAKAEGFKGKAGKALEIVAPAGLKAERLIVVGSGRRKDRKPTAFLKAGGAVMGKVPASAKAVTVLLELPDGKVSGRDAADFALGMRLRAYKFDRYKTKRKEGDDKEKDAPVKAAVTVATADVSGARAAWAERTGLADGVLVARDLINEPPNVLYPIEFARRTSSLKKLGIAVEVLDIKAMAKLGMGAILGVGQGSHHESRVVIMRWNGGKKNEPPLAFIGKGVCFDTGGISIKPAASMEDMKGDMAGAACVVGLMHALAARKARVNVVGAIGLTENMPSGHAQRPGDIVKSLSGQTIEVVNTDAEGRLVLADVVTLVKDRYQPKFMIDLATLTGAILVALGQEYAGLFSNDDKLAKRLIEAGEETGERVWRMPLGPEYDKMIDSKFADMKNVGNGRHAGATAGAQFIQRYVDKTPWAHLDIAGTGMGPPPSEINTSWGPGWGVRLLDRLVEEHYER